MIWNIHAPLDSQLHALASDDLFEALHVAVRYHHVLSIVLILTRLVKENRIYYVLGNICCHNQCKECWSNRLHLLHYLQDRTVLERDFANVRAQIRTARLTNCFAIQRHFLLMNPITDVVARHILETSKRNWTKATAVVFAVLMWNAWKRRQLHPDSRYIRGLAARFTAYAKQASHAPSG